MLGEINVQGATHINKGLKSNVVAHFIVNAIGSDGIVGNVVHVRLSEVQSCVHHRVCDAVDHGMLLSLDLVERFTKFPVMLEELIVVVEDV